MVRKAHSQTLDQFSDSEIVNVAILAGYENDSMGQMVCDFNRFLWPLKATSKAGGSQIINAEVS